MKGRSGNSTLLFQWRIPLCVPPAASSHSAAWGAPVSSFNQQRSAPGCDACIHSAVSSPFSSCSALLQLPSRHRDYEVCCAAISGIHKHGEGSHRMPGFIIKQSLSGQLPSKHADCLRETILSCTLSMRVGRGERGDILALYEDPPPSQWACQHLHGGGDGGIMAWPPMREGIGASTQRPGSIEWMHSASTS